MNVKSDKFSVNGQTSSKSNLNTRWNYVIKVGCFEIIVFCVEHIHGILIFYFWNFGEIRFFLVPAFAWGLQWPFQTPQGVRWPVVWSGCHGSEGVAS